MINVVCIGVSGDGSDTWIGFALQDKCEGGSERDSGIHMTRESYTNGTITCPSPSNFLMGEN